jgi:hypothetical protein
MSNQGIVWAHLATGNTGHSCVKIDHARNIVESGFDAEQGGVDADGSESEELREEGSSRSESDMTEAEWAPVSIPALAGRASYASSIFARLSYNIASSRLDPHNVSKMTAFEMNARGL